MAAQISGGDVALQAWDEQFWRPDRRCASVSEAIKTVLRPRVVADAHDWVPMRRGPAAAARSPFSLPDTGQLHQLMDGAGLRAVEVHSHTNMLRFPSPAQFVAHYAWASPIAAALGDADPSVLEPVIADVADVVAPQPPRRCPVVSHRQPPGPGRAAIANGRPLRYPPNLRSIDALAAAPTDAGSCHRRVSKAEAQTLRRRPRCPVGTHGHASRKTGSVNPSR